MYMWHKSLPLPEMVDIFLCNLHHFKPHCPMGFIPFFNKFEYDSHTVKCTDHNRGSLPPPQGHGPSDQLPSPIFSKPHRGQPWPPCPGHLSRRLLSTLQASWDIYVFIKLQLWVAMDLTLSRPNGFIYHMWIPTSEQFLGLGNISCPLPSFFFLDCCK